MSCKPCLHCAHCSGLRNMTGTNFEFSSAVTHEEFPSNKESLLSYRDK
uniref:Uncharacterized protein n=1 Tax=Leptobrachium leishanense TaxID=445787 RepID=A0A8C5MQN7_9ANUR